MRTKERVCSLRSSAALALLISDWDTSAPLYEYSTLTSGAHTTSPSSLEVCRLSGSSRTSIPVAI